MRIDFTHSAFIGRSIERTEWRSNMARTAVGLFENQTLANQVARELQAAGFPPGEVRVLVNPLDLPVTGVLSTPDTDFMASLCRDLREIGAKKEEADAYIVGVQKGGALVFAAGPIDKVDAAAEIMNRHSAKDVEELAGLEPVLHTSENIGIGSSRRESTLAGRIRQFGGGARVFVW
jgi:hypothetical protein